MVKRATSSDLRTVGWYVLGAIPFVIGLLMLVMSIREFNLWLHADHYIEAELEVTKFHYVQGGEGLDAERKGSATRRRGGTRRSRSTSRPNPIEGIIHPGGETVHTDDREIAVAVFDEPDDVAGRTPTREEVEGKRFPVLHWPNHEAEKRWWHPATTTSAAKPTDRDVLVHGGITLFLIGLGVLGFAKARMKPRADRPSGPGTWPAWTGLVTGLFLLVCPVFLVMLSVFTKGTKMNKAGTERLPWTAQEWMMASIPILMTGIPSLVCLILLERAVRNRCRERLVPLSAVE